MEIARWRGAHVGRTRRSTDLGSHLHQQLGSLSQPLRPSSHRTGAARDTLAVAARREPLSMSADGYFKTTANYNDGGHPKLLKYADGALSVVRNQLLASAKGPLLNVGALQA